MTGLLSVFASVVLPIVAVSAVGYLLGHARDVDVGSLNAVAIYALLPALVFHSLATTTFDRGTVLTVLGGVALYVLAMVAVTEGVGRLLGDTEPLLSALVLVSVFPNSGNYGIPLAEFAFDGVGRDTAVLFLVGQSVLFWTVGVAIASRGSGATARTAMTSILRLPLLYAVAAAGLARWLGVVPPAGSTAMATLSLVGNAAIPVMLLILGIQLSEVDYATTVSRLGTATILKMGVAPVVGLLVALAVGFEDPTVARVFVLETATPAAVTVLVLLIEVAGDATVDGVAVSEYASAAVLTTTLVSIPVLTAVIALLEAGVVF